MKRRIIVVIACIFCLSLSLNITNVSAESIGTIDLWISQPTSSGIDITWKPMPGYSSTDKEINSAVSVEFRNGVEINDADQDYYGWGDTNAGITKLNPYLTASAQTSATGGELHLLTNGYIDNLGSSITYHGYYEANESGYLQMSFDYSYYVSLSAPEGGRVIGQWGGESYIGDIGIDRNTGEWVGPFLNQGTEVFASPLGGRRELYDGSEWSQAFTGTVTVSHWCNATNLGEFYLELNSNIQATPEPATMLLFGAGLVGLAGFGRKKFKK